MRVGDTRWALSVGVPRLLDRRGRRTMRGRCEEVSPMTPSTTTWTADELVARYDEVRSHTERLAAPLSPEDQTVQSMPDVSPTKWHRAHVTWFFETFVLEPSLAGYRPFDERFGYLFNSYYEAVGPRHERSQRGLLTRPGAAAIGEYRAHVDAA